MQSATPATVLAPFAGERFTHAGVTSTFRQQGGKFFVRTDGHDGKMAEFEVTHTLGVTPLQQYLIPVANGGMQALGIAWDARPRRRAGSTGFSCKRASTSRPGTSCTGPGASKTSISCAPSAT
jgi:hypothetical protein